MKQTVDNNQTQAAGIPAAYTPPSIEVVEVKVEQGFQISSDDTSPTRGDKSW